ncbi:hypothetical protein KR026_009331 [Drosophila bipectinata]|nr:hypothetical protein KR026_009331 [Drosophila bipectinata]
MYSYILYFILISMTAADDNLKVVKYENSVDTIVKDLIGSWQSPIVYLKSRGYLPNDMQEAPEMDFEQLQGNSELLVPIKESNKDSLEFKRQAASVQENGPVIKAKISESKVQEVAPETVTVKETKLLDSDSLRPARSFENVRDNELKQMFQNLFSTNDENVSNEIKSKLDVTWDMDSIKHSARQGAMKYLDKFNSKRAQQGSLLYNEPIDISVSKEVSQNYPSLVPSKLTRKSNMPNYFKGVAKIMGSSELRNKEKPVHQAAHRKQKH